MQKNTWRDLLVLMIICATNPWLETTRNTQESMLLVEIEECAHASRRETQRKIQSCVFSMVEVPARLMRCGRKIKLVASQNTGT